MVKLSLALKLHLPTKTILALKYIIIPVVNMTPKYMATIIISLDLLNTMEGKIRMVILGANQ
jgi:hypothetical protein